MALKTGSTYLDKHSNYPAFIQTKVKDDLSLVVVIPSYNEPNIISTLESLSRCKFEGFSVEIIVVINQSEEVTENVNTQNEICYDDTKSWSHDAAAFNLYTIFVKDIPIKKAGVGYARKTGMDEAVRRLEETSSDQKLIVALDADTIVEPNYLQEIYSYFKSHPKCPAASIDYAHPMDDNDTRTNQAILQYELHLRYYVLAQRWSGLKYAHQTVGSAMVVRSLDYQKQGGMNTRKAGEDFYFIHKFTHYPFFGNITKTKVIPSARISDRVPFGTGRAMQTILSSGEALTSYAPQSFAAIKKFVEQIHTLYEGESELKSAEAMSIFLRNHQFSKKLAEIRSNTKDYQSFKKRLLRWFDAFQCMKFLHYARDHHYPNIPIADAANWLNQATSKDDKSLGELELLTIFRAQTKEY